MSAQFKTSDKPVSSLTICPAYTTKPFTYRNYKGVEITVPASEYIYVDVAAGVALIGKDHVEIDQDEYSCVSN
jgi:hypothetical protein